MCNVDKNNKVVENKLAKSIYAFVSNVMPDSSNLKQFFKPSIPTSISLLAKLDRKTAMKWHLAFNHISFERLALMCKMNTITGLTPGMSDMFTQAKKHIICQHCLLGRYPATRVNKISMTRNKTYDVGQYLYIDTIPMDDKSIGNNKFALILNDRASSYTIMDTMASNHVTKNIIPTLLRMLGKIKLMGKKVEFIHGDSDSVFIAQDLIDVLIKEPYNIRISFSPPGEHKMSGSIESTIKNIRGHSRIMLLSTGLPPKFWGAAFQQSVFIRNRVITMRHKGHRINSNKSPYEIWFKRKPIAANIALFGAACVTRAINPHKLKSMAARLTWYIDHLLTVSSLLQT
jgi:hypothetical protein